MNGHACMDPERQRQLAAEREAEAQRNTSDALQRLRALRVWHYRQLLRARGFQRSCASASLARQYESDAATHLGFVQSLNDFFPMGDTAEADSVKA